MRTRIPILCQMERISNHRSDMGIWNGIFQRWRYVIAIQTMTSTLKLIFKILKMPSIDLIWNLNNKKSLIQVADDKTNFLINQLEEEIHWNGKRIQFYGQSYKNNQTHIKTQNLPTIIIEPPSPTLTINEILLLIFTNN